VNHLDQMTIGPGVVNDPIRELLRPYPGGPAIASMAAINLATRA
jgi:hypothetical protein